MDQEKGPLIPCVYCSHANPASHRFCGICGKALPDLVKQAAKPVPASSGSPSTGGIGMASRSPQPPSSPRTPSPRQENPNRDLSYLLHDDHVPTPTSRVPFIVGGLILVAVAGFFALRGGGKAAPTSVPADGSAAETTAETPPAAAKPTPGPGPTDGAKAEAAPPPEVPVQARKVNLPAVEPAPPKPVRHAAPVAKPPAAQPSHTAKKPPPAKAASAAAVEPVSEVAASSSDDCEKQMPRLRKAALGPDAKAKADLGLAYYTGRCAPRDLPTAYHWYALALRAAPESPLVSAQLEAIWKQMSPAERQLALKAQ